MKKYLLKKFIYRLRVFLLVLINKNESPDSNSLIIFIDKILKFGVILLVYVSV